MVKLAILIVGSREKAEEIVQEAFIKVHSNWSSLTNPGGFLRKTVVNMCHDALRRRSVKRKYLKILQKDHSDSRFRDKATELVADRRSLVDLLGELGPKRRTALVLKYYGGYTIAEISELTNTPEGTVCTNLRRGLQEIRRAMK